MSIDTSPHAIQDAVRETAIDGQLRLLKMPGSMRHYRDLTRQARAQGQDLLAYLESVLAVELESRRHNQIAQRLRDARFPYPRDIDGFDFTQAPSVNRAKILELCTGRFVGEREGAILIGPSGTGNYAKPGVMRSRGSYSAQERADAASCLS